MPFAWWIVKGVLKVTTCTEAKIDTLLESQFAAGRLYAAISSRPGQSGRADGYILEGKELEVRFDQPCAGGRSADVGLCCAVLPQEDQDRQAEACARGIGGVCV